MTDAASVTQLVRACAWCDRVWTAVGWQPIVPVLRDAGRETSTICCECVDRLRALNLSR